MNSKLSDDILSQTEVMKLLAETQNYEYSWQVNEGINRLKPFWTQFDAKPKIDGFSLSVQGEALLRCGTLLSNLCHLEQLNYQDLARDWFSESAAIFTRIGDLSDKIAEVETELAMTYWREGRYPEALTWLETASEKNTNELSPVSIRNVSYTILILACMNTSDGYQRGAALVRKMDICARLCGDSRVKAHYYNNSAILMTRIGNMIGALERHHQTVHYCREVGNQVGVAIAENNIGWIYMYLGEMDKAQIHTNAALEKFTEFNDNTRLAECWDTKAQIHLELNETNAASACIAKSLEILEQGDDYKTRLASLNTKVRILARSGRIGEALMVFGYVHETSRFHISEAAAEGYANDFAKNIHIKTGESFYKQTEKFEKSLIHSALVSAGGLIGRAAARLDLSEATLAELLHVRHRDLLKEFDLENVVRSLRVKLILSGKKSGQKAAENKLEIKTEMPHAAPKLREVDLKEYDCNGFPVLIPESVEVSFFMQFPAPARLASIGLVEGRVAVVSSGYAVPDKFPAVVQDFINSTIYYGFRVDACGLVGLEGDDGEPIALAPEQVEHLGKIIGYCEFDFAAKIYHYHPLDL